MKKSTDNRDSIEEIKMRQAYLEAVLESAPDAIVTLDAESNITSWNKSAERLFGYTSAEAIGKDIDDLVANADPVIHKEAVGFSGQVSSKQLVGPIETIRYRKDGTPVNVILSGSPVSVNNNFEGSVAVYTDITERVWSEETLQESEERYRSFVQNFQGIAFHGKMDFTPIFFHGAVEKITGYTEDEFLIGKPRWDQVIYSDDMSTLLTEDEKKLHSVPNYSYDREYRIVRKDGKIGWVHEVIQNICDDSGKPTLVQGAIYDITERKRAEETLRENEKLLRTIAENYPNSYVSIIEKDFTIGFTSGQEFNKQNRDPEQFIGLTLEQVFGDKASIVRQQYEKTFEGEERSFELFVNNQNQHYRTVPLYAEDGSIPRILAVVENITERKRAEDKLRRRTQELSGLHTLSKEISATLSMEHLVAAALDGILKVLHPDLVYFFLRDGEKLNLIATAPESAQPDFEIPEHRVGECMCGLAVTAGKALYSRDINKDVRCTWDECKKAGFRSFAALPLWVDSEIVGLLGLASTSERDFESEAEYIETIAHQISTSLQNVLLYERLEERTHQLEIEVGERKRAEEALRESQQMLRLVLDTIPVRVFWKDHTSHYLGCNRPFALDAGLSLPEEIIGRNDFELGWKDQAEIYRADDQTVIETGLAKLNYEEPQTTPTGRTIWLHTSKVPLVASSGHVRGVLGTYEDITERKRAEDALRQSEARYRTLFENAKDAIFLENEEDEIIDANRQACEMMGYTREELLQMTVPELQAPEVRGVKGTVIKQELEKYRGELFETLNVHHDGTRFPVEVSTASIPGQVAGLALAIVRDITERKRVEEEIRGYIKHIETMLEIERVISSTLNLEEVLSIIMTELAKAIPYDSISLQMLKDDSLEILACRGFDQPGEVLGLVFPLDPKFPNQRVIEENKTLAFEDVVQEYPHFQSESSKYRSGHIRSWLGVPLISKGEVTGMIALDRSEVNPFSDTEIQLAVAVASNAILAIENARLFGEAQRRLEFLSSLRHIDRVIASNLDLRVTLDILLRQVLHQLDVDAAAVLLYRPELQSLEFVAGQGFRTQALHFTDLHLGQGFAGRAALEQHVIQVHDLSTMQTGFLRSPEFRNEGFVSYIGVPLITKGNIIGVLEIYHRQSLDHDREWMSFLETLAGQAAIAIDNIRLFEELQTSNLQLRQAYDATIEGWALALEMRDRETEGHSRRVVDWTLELARKLSIEEKQLVHIRRGALLHDIGKMGVPDSILQKPDKLTEEEWRIIQQHPVYAHQWLASILYLQASLDIPYCHHEKWDGTGYPRGLKGEQIPLAARIFSVVDVWDALLSDRSYRKAWSQEKTLAYLCELSGQHFDPQVVEAFIELLSEKGYLATS